MKKMSILFALLIITINVFCQINSNNKILGYFTSWSVYERNYHVSNIPVDKVDFILYAFANIENGQITFGDYYADVDKFYLGDSWDAGSLRGSFHQLQLLKQQNPDIKTLISVGGWTLSGQFSVVASTPESRLLFANSCVQFIEQFGFDGIDIDWEYPVNGGLDTNFHSPDDKHNFTLLLQQIRSKLNELDHPAYLTIAVPASAILMENYEFNLIHPYLDYINIMTYDYHGAGSSEADCVTHLNSPLYPDVQDSLIEPYHSQFNIRYTINEYLNYSITPQKLVLGLPFYAKGYGNVPNQNNGLFQSYSGNGGLGSRENRRFDYWDQKIPPQPIQNTDSNTVVSPYSCIDAYPNPFNETITIENKENKLIEVTIFNVKGQIIEKFSLESKQTKKWENINCKSSGLYFIKTNMNSIIKKIIQIK